MLLYHGIVNVVVECINMRLRSFGEMSTGQEVVLSALPAPDRSAEIGNWPQLMRSVAYEALTTTRLSQAQKRSKAPEASEFHKRAMKTVVERFLQRCGMNRTLNVLDKSHVRITYTSDLVAPSQKRGLTMFRDKQIII